MTMPVKKLTSLLGVLLLASAGILGCASQSTDEGGSESTVDAHNHPTEGPHHGSVLELGKEEYHAELLHDEDEGSVTIYVLDSTAKETVPIAASELTINLSHDGHVDQFTLAAEPDTGDPEGKSSRFTSTESHLVEELNHAEAQLVLTIAGKQYRGAISHDHDHEEHDH